MKTATPDDYLDAADEMLRGAGCFGALAVADGWWPKACACLIRLALECGVDAYWQRVSPPVTCASGRTKHLLLRRRNREVGRRVSYAWGTLSSAIHHQCYEMAPAAGELRRLHAEVTALLRELASLTMNGETPKP